ncbi:MAG: flagellar motor switch protein FliN [Chitinivibrionales bacterium]|nr:flagellar motor switch protein FliN [Chitinivibrionales bacterium]
MSDQLSQNQIDSLLTDANLSGSGAEPLTEEASAEAGPKNYEALAGVFDVFIQQAVSVLSTLLNKTVRFQIIQSGAAEAAAIGAVGPALLAVEIPFNAEGAGTFTIVIDKKEVAALSDLMMMGDGKAEYTEDHRDAIGELFNQVVGAFAGALTGKHGVAASIGTVSVKDFDIAAPSFALDQVDMGILKITVTDIGDAPLAVLITSSVAETLMQKLSAPPEEGASEGDAGNASTSLNAAELSDLSTVTMPSAGSENSSSFTESSLGSSTGASTAARENVEMLMDITLDVSIELGRTLMSVKRVLELAPGSVVELDRMAGEPVDLLVNDKVVAKGEVVVVDENFGIRIVSLVSPEERIRSLR